MPLDSYRSWTNRNDQEKTLVQQGLCIKRDHRVPFMLKLAGQKTGLTYNTPINTLLTRELLLLIMQGKLKSEGEVAEWLTQNTRLAESPFTFAPLE